MSKYPYKAVDVSTLLNYIDLMLWDFLKLLALLFSCYLVYQQLVLELQSRIQVRTIDRQKVKVSGMEKFDDTNFGY